MRIDLRGKGVAPDTITNVAFESRYFGEATDAVVAAFAGVISLMTSIDPPEVCMRYAEEQPAGLQDSRRWSADSPERGAFNYSAP